MSEENYAKMCKALGDPIRLSIFNLLKTGTKCACVLLENFDVTQPTLSYHMKALIASGLVVCEQDGKWSNYSLNCAAVQELTGYLSTKCRSSDISTCHDCHKR